MSTFTYNEEEFQLPTGPIRDLELMDAYDVLQKLEDQYYANDDDAAQLKLIKENGFTDKDHFDNYKSYVSDNIDFAAYAQKKMNEQVAAQRKQFSDNAASMSDSGVLAPISGVTLENYAHISSQLSQGADYKELLKKYGIESVSWEKASEGWNERMKTDTTFTVINEYGKFFMAAGQGQFGDIGKEVADTMSGKGDSKQKNPMSLELYAEVTAAQGAAAAQGKDVQEVLAGYGLNAADYATLGGHWANKMMSDMNVATKFGDLLTKFTEKFSSSIKGAGDDINF